MHMTDDEWRTSMSANDLRNIAVPILGRFYETEYPDLTQEQRELMTALLLSDSNINIRIDYDDSGQPLLAFIKH